MEPDWIKASNNNKPNIQVSCDINPNNNNGKKTITGTSVTILQLIRFIDNMYFQL